MDVGWWWRGRFVNKPSVDWKTEKWLFGSEKLCVMMMGIMDLISRRSICQFEPADQLLWSTAGCLEMIQTFISGRLHPTTFNRLHTPVS